MGYYVARNSRGVLTQFKIKGENPSSTEMDRINNYLSGQPLVATATTPPPTDDDEPGILESAGSGLMRFINEYHAGLDRVMESRYRAVGDNDSADAWAKGAEQQLKDRDSYRLPEGGFFESQNKLASLAGTAGGSALPMAAVIGGTLAAPFTGGASLTATAMGLGALAYGPAALSQNAERQIEQHGYIKDWTKA